MLAIIPVVSQSPISTPFAVPSFGSGPTSQNPLRRQPPLWMLIMVQLDARQFDFTPDDIAPLLGIQAKHVRKYCCKLWPDNSGHWKLSFEDAAVLIQRVCRDGSRLPEAMNLWRELSSAGIVKPGFPDNNPDIKRAELAISQFQAQQAQQRRMSREMAD